MTPQLQKYHYNIADAKKAYLINLNTQLGTQV